MVKEKGNVVFARRHQEVTTYKEKTDDRAATFSRSKSPSCCGLISTISSRLSFPVVRRFESWGQVSGLKYEVGETKCDYAYN